MIPEFPENMNHVMRRDFDPFAAEIMIGGLRAPQKKGALPPPRVKTDAHDNASAVGKFLVVKRVDFQRVEHFIAPAVGADGVEDPMDEYFTVNGKRAEDKQIEVPPALQFVKRHKRAVSALVFLPERFHFSCEFRRFRLGLQRKAVRTKHISLQVVQVSGDELIVFRQIAGAKQDLEQYQADLEAQEQRMRQIEEEMRRREEEARKKAQEEGKTYTTADLGNISFKWPCPASSRITSQFGDRESPTEGASSNHKGIDIGAASGSDILAAASGTVVIATYSYSAGNYIMIDHGGGVSTVYMHCSQLLAAEGDEVSQGQVIAKVGSTGYSTGPHLHFGIRSDGSYVNPLNYVSP